MTGSQSKIRHLTLPFLLFILLVSSTAYALAPDPDLNGDGLVDALDVSTVSSCFGHDLSVDTHCQCADSDGNNVIDFTDYLFVTSSYGQSGFPIGPNPCVAVNNPPTANAGPDQSGFVGDTVVLDGSSSFDVDGNPLSFSWSFVSRPAGSSAVLSDPTAVNPSFTIDVYGDYEVELTVNDGIDDSAPDSVVVSTINSPPVANAGPDQTARVGDAVTLDGSASSDVDGNALTFSWSFTNRPAGSSAILSDATAVNPTFDVDVFGSYTIQLIVNDGTVDSAVDTVTITTLNSPPVADAGPNQTAHVGDTVTLDGSGSSDVDGNSLEFTWSFSSRPPGSGATLSDVTAVNPSFTIDLPGTYVLQLVVNDGTVDSAPDTVTITTDNSPPVADAGTDQTALVGDTVSLDGSGSSDVDGDSLDFTWSFSSRPPGSGATLSDVTAVNPSFTIDLPGTYILQLVVNDGTVDSAPDTVTITTNNSPPVADAGSDQTALVGDTVSLDGSGSSDVDGDSLDFTWSFSSRPPGSGATLSDVTAVNPSFTIDLPGTYVLQLVVNDGTVDSAPDTVTITTDNSPPVADAGPDQTVLVGDTVTLDGSGSSDVDGDSLDFSWSFTSRPSGSSATLSDPTAIMPSFDVDAFGTYVLQLIVNDGTVDSAVDTVSITTDNSPPVADAGPDQTALVGDTVTLDGTGSFDVDGNPLTFSWSFTSRPSGSTATLSDSTDQTPSFDIDLPGSYILQLIVNDGTVNSVSPDTVTITTTNSAPVASAGVDQSVFVGDLVTLNGSGSFDVDLDPLTFDWSILSAPGGSSATLSSTTAESPNITPDLAGDYLFQLIVNDGNVNSAPDSALVSATALPTLTIDDVSVSEGDAGTVDMNFTVSLTPATTRTVTLDFATANGSASSLDDYVATSGSLSFAPGETSKTVTVTVNGDTDFEPDETVLVNLSAAVNAVITDSQGIGTIINDDAQIITISLTPNPMNLFSNGSGDLTITLSQNAGTGGQVVDLVSDTPTVAAVPTSVTVLEGNNTATVQVTAGTTAGTAEITASATGLTSGTTNVVVSDRSMTLTLQGPLVGIARTISGTVDLALPAPAGGVTVNLSTGNTAVATVSPASVFIAEGLSQASFNVTGVAVGTTPVNATASGFGDATTSIEVTSSTINFGVIPTLAPDQSFSLPVSLSEPAPTGGVEIFFTSSDPSTASITPSVFIPEGLQVPAANPQVTGILIGTVQITGTAIGYAPDIKDAVVTLVLNFSPPSFNLFVGRTSPITLDLSAPAPIGGLLVNLTTDDAGIATVPATVVIGAGETSAQVDVSGVSVNTTTLRASASGVSEATAAIVVDPAPPINMYAPPTVGKDLQTTYGGTLGAVAPAGNLEVTLTSADPSKLILSTDRTTAGSASITIQVPAGTSAISGFYVQALDEVGTIEIAVSAPGYADGTGSVVLAPSGFVFITGDITTDVFATNTAMNFRSGRLFPSTNNLAAWQELRGGHTVPVGFTNSNPSVGTVTINPFDVSGGSGTSHNTYFDPLASGDTVLRLTQPSGFTEPTNYSVEITATVNAPDIYVTPATTVGQDLQTTANISLSSAPPTPIDVTLTVADPTVALLSLDRTAAGSSSVTFTGVTSTSVGSVYVQGLQSGSNTQITATAPDYNNGIGTAIVVPSGLYIVTGNITTDIFATNTTISIRSGRLNPSSLYYLASQELRGGYSLSLDLTNSDPSVGALTVNPIIMIGGTGYNYYTAFDPLTSGGPIDLHINQPSGFTEPANQAVTITATVNAPNINITPTTTVGRDLQTTANISLSSAPPTPIDITVTVDNPSAAILSLDRTGAGSSSVTFTGVTSTGVGSVYVQGLTSGSSTQITASSPDYNNGVATVNVVPAGFGIITPNINTDVFATNSSITLRSGRMDPSTDAIISWQELRGGHSVLLDFTNSDPSVGTLTVDPIIATGGNGYNYVTYFDPVASGGPIDLHVIQPSGFTIPTNYANTITATVDAPDVNITSAVGVGENLQTTAYISLSSAPPSPIDVTVTIASSSVALISSSSTVVGTNTVIFSGVTSHAVGTVYVQGLQLGDTQITAQAPAYNDGVSNVTVDPSGFRILTADFTTDVDATNTNINVRSSRLNPTTLNHFQYQPVRGGLTVLLDFTNDAPGVGTVTPNPLTVVGGSGSSFNTQFDPIAVGVSTITLDTPSGFSTASDGNLELVATVEDAMAVTTKLVLAMDDLVATDAVVVYGDGTADDDETSSGSLDWLMLLAAAGMVGRRYRRLRFTGK